MVAGQATDDEVPIGHHVDDPVDAALLDPAVGGQGHQATEGPARSAAVGGRMEQGDRTTVGVANQQGARVHPIGDGGEEAAEPFGLDVQPVGRPGPARDRGRSAVSGPVVGQHRTPRLGHDPSGNASPLPDRAEAVVEQHDLGRPLAP